MNENFEFKDLLSFEKLLFPTVARLVYLILAGISILIGFVSLSRGLGAEWGGEAMVISGLVMMTIIPILIRLSFECILIFFKINDKLNEIRETLPKPTDDFSH